MQFMKGGWEGWWGGFSRGGYLTTEAGTQSLSAQLAVKEDRPPNNRSAARGRTVFRKSWACEVRHNPPSNFEPQ